MMVTVLSRQEWGALPPRAVDRNFTKDGGVVVHYTASDASGVTAHWPQCYDRWKGHQRYHMDAKGWNDLAYNFGMCIHGFVFEGRGWDAQNGANRPENSSTLSICLDVDANDTFDEAVIVNMNKLIAEAVDEQGWARRLRGHYEVSTTGTPCPGANVRALMVEGKIRLPPTPPTDPTPPTTGGVLLLGGDVAPLAMQDWARSKGGTELFVQLAAPARSYSLELGVNPAVTYSIMGHETAFGRFGGVLDVSFKNWGGIKTAGGGGNFDPNAHHRFISHREGVRAVAQHVAGYAGLTLPDEGLVDPRFRLLAGKRIDTLPSRAWSWASDGYGHSQKIAAYANEMS